MKRMRWPVFVVLTVTGVLSGWMAFRMPAPRVGTPPPKPGPFTVTPTSAPAPGANAADLYRQAILLVGQLRQDPADAALYDRYSSGSFDAETAAFLKKHAAITGLIRTAARAESANWGEIGIEERLKQLNSVRDLFRLILIESKYAAQEGNSALALEDALAGMAMAHHLGRDGMLVARLVEVACDVQAIDAIARILPSLTSEQLASLPKQLDSLPKPSTGVKMMAAEFAYAKTQQNGVMLTAMINSMEPFYKDAGVALDTKPPAEFDKWIDAEMPKYALNPQVKILAPSLKRIRATLAVVEAKRAMLDAAIKIQSEGESALARSVDPFGSGPFQYRKNASNFTLSSQLLEKDQPVNLVVGK